LGEERERERERERKREGDDVCESRPKKSKPEPMETGRFRSVRTASAACLGLVAAPNVG